MANSKTVLHMKCFVINNLICAVDSSGTLPSPCRNQASSLALLIAQMQSNADQVEKDILRSEELLAVVRTR